MKAKIFLVLLLATLFKAQDQDEVDYYVNLLSDASKNALTYQWPTNAYEYFSNSTRHCYGKYDFVVIGAGAGGSVAANRLSEIKKWKVLVLEAGTYGNNLTNVPAAPGIFSSYNWAYNNTPQETSCLGTKDHVCMYPRGKGVGGTSLINGGVYARGYKADFDQWAKLSGNSRWNYNSTLRYFKKSENFVHNNTDAPYDPDIHGIGGYYNVEYHQPNSPQVIAFLKANEQVGYKIVDYNANKLGAALAQLNTVHGKRLDDGKAFLQPVKDRKNLKILPDSYVTKIRFDKRKRAIGVEFSRNGKNYFVNVRKEVILSAGAFGSPQILMLSGVGPKKHLEKLNIDVVADLEVGSTLIEHAGFFGITANSNYTEPIKSLEEYVKEFLRGEGPLAIPGNNAGVGYYESSYSKGTGSPDIELEFIPANATSGLRQKSYGLTDETYEDLWKYANPTQSFIIYVANLHPVTVGTVRLKNKDPYEYPLINARLLADPENKDIKILYEGIQIVLKLLETEAFKAINATLQGGPLRACKQHVYLSEDYWYCALRQVTLTFWHPVGTCRMGTDPKEGAVVDSELKVFGFKNLRIVDASVIPIPLAGHPTASIVMVGEQLGDIVKQAHSE